MKIEILAKKYNCPTAKEAASDILNSYFDQREESLAKKKETDPSLKAPKEWWDKMVKRVKAGNPSYDDDQVKKTVGHIWANELTEAKRTEIRERYGKKYGKAKIAASVLEILAEKYTTEDEVEDQEADSMTESDKLKKYGPVVKTFPSSSNPNKTYEVRKQKGEEPTCNCPGWANRRTCKHLDAIKHMPPAVAQVTAPSPKDAVADLLNRYFEKRAEAVAASLQKNGSSRS